MDTNTEIVKVIKDMSNIIDMFNDIEINNINNTMFESNIVKLKINQCRLLNYINERFRIDSLEFLTDDIYSFSQFEKLQINPQNQENLIKWQNYINYKFKNIRLLISFFRSLSDNTDKSERMQLYKYIQNMIEVHNTELFNEDIVTITDFQTKEGYLDKIIQDKMEDIIFKTSPTDRPITLYRWTPSKKYKSINLGDKFETDKPTSTTYNSDFSFKTDFIYQNSKYKLMAEGTVHSMLVLNILPNTHIFFIGNAYNYLQDEVVIPKGMKFVLKNSYIIPFDGPKNIMTHQFEQVHT